MANGDDTVRLVLMKEQGEEGDEPLNNSFQNRSIINKTAKFAYLMQHHAAMRAVWRLGDGLTCAKSESPFPDPPTV